MAVSLLQENKMTKKKPKAYRGIQSYITEEQISVLSKNPYRGQKGSGHTQLQTNVDIIHMIGKLQQQIQYLEKETDFLKKFSLTIISRKLPTRALKASKVRHHP